MNAFILHNSELVSKGRYSLHLDKQPGSTEKVYAAGLLVKGLVMNGKRCRLKVLAQKERVLELEVCEELEAIPKKDITAIVGISRPQTMKKVIHTAQVCGVKTLVLLKAAEAEKSYFQAEALRPENIQHELGLAMAQAWDSLPCEVLLRERFRTFVEDELNGMINPESLRVLAEVQAQEAKLPVESARGLVLTIGPELGWNNFEQEQFQKQGFQAISCGQRIMRVETAFGYMLGRLGAGNGSD